MMPPGSSPVLRAEQMATLRQIAHDLLTGAEIGLDRAEQDAGGLEPWRAANLREMRRSRRRGRHARGPDRGLGALSRDQRRDDLARGATALGFRRAAPGARGGRAPDRRRPRPSPQRSAGPLRCTSGWLRAGHRHRRDRRPVEPLAAFLPDALERPGPPGPPLPLQGHFPPAAEALGERLMQALGFDFEHGRLDEPAPVPAAACPTTSA